MHTKGPRIGKRVVHDHDTDEVWQGRVAGQASRGSSTAQALGDLW